MNVIKVNMELMDSIENNYKKAATRLGIKTNYTLGPVKFVNATNAEDVLDNNYEIYKIEAIDFCDLPKELALEEGFSSLKRFKDKLVEIYGPIEDYATLTVISWDR